MSGWFVLLVSLAYLCLLFGIAWAADRQAGAGRSLINNPYVYTLSLAVYCTSWTFYGSVGRAATHGFDFLAVYLGPTLVFIAWPLLLAKILRISKLYRITSIADFIASRYGKSAALAGLVSVIAVVGILPYIGLQLKAVSASLKVLVGEDAGLPGVITKMTGVPDSALVVAMVLAVFAILFGTRHIEASEQHEGMVAAIAFESVVKLAAFLAVGLFVAFGLFDGFADLFAQASERRDVARIFSLQEVSSYPQWISVTILSMAAIVCLPRQFQVTVIENIDERHLRKAAWLFPLYLLAINVFVLPIAAAGLLLREGGAAEAEMFMLTLPLSADATGLALFAYVGGLSAATGMVIVATIALSTMVCNDLAMPVLLRVRRLRLGERGDVQDVLLRIRRAAIVLILLMGYGYYRFIGESYTLVTIGLVSFLAAAQFAPSIVIGLYWRGATKAGAMAGLSAGFAMWLYTLLLPSFALSGWLPLSFVDDGPFGIALLRPHAFLGLDGLDTISHALFWTMAANVGAFVAVSLSARQGLLERTQAARFVDVFHRTEASAAPALWPGSATMTDLYNLAVRFVGPGRARQAFRAYARRRGIDLAEMAEADIDAVRFTERLLAGAIGAASARVMVATVAEGEDVNLEQVMRILDEASEVIEYSHQLEQKSRELERATADLRAANERLQELDRLKDDFLSTISHELRTPLTSIRSFGEILIDNPALEAAERAQFAGIVVKESERLTRLIDQILDLSRLEAGRMEWRMERLDPAGAVSDAVDATRALFRDAGIELALDVERGLPAVEADRDRLIQVIVNLVSNAVKFCPRPGGRVGIAARRRGAGIEVTVVDNGPGIAPGAREAVFERFHQSGDTLTRKPSGTGLGLPICRQIVDRFGGRIWAEAAAEGGARLVFTLPAAAATTARAAE